MIPAFRANWLLAALLAATAAFMSHESNLLSLLAAGLVLAFALGALAHRLRLSPLVGYLLAGVMVGPWTPGYEGDAGLASQLGEIGVVLLMFGVGLHFSVDDLKQVRRIALPWAVFPIAAACGLGALVAHGPCDLSNAGHRAPRAPVGRAP